MAKEIFIMLVKTATSFCLGHHHKTQSDLVIGTVSEQR